MSQSDKLADPSRIRAASAKPDSPKLSEAGKDIMKTIPLVGIASKWADVADKHYMTNDLALVNLARHVGEGVRARNRDRWFVGRIVNWMTGTSPDFVRLSGAVIENAARYVGDAVPTNLTGTDYELRLDVAQDILERAKARARIEGLL